MQDEPSSNVDSKPFFQSRTFVGLAVLLIPIVARKLGFKLDDSAALQIAEQLADLLGALLVIIGRLRASKTLTLGVAPKDAAALLLGGCFSFAALQYLTGCSRVESLRGAAGLTKDFATGAVGGTIGGEIHFRDGHDAKTIKPLGWREEPPRGQDAKRKLEGRATDVEQSLGVVLRNPFRMDIESMDRAADFEFPEGAPFAINTKSARE